MLNRSFVATETVVEFSKVFQRNKQDGESNRRLLLFVRIKLSAQSSRTE